MILIKPMLFCKGLEGTTIGHRNARIAGWSATLQIDLESGKL